jgi:hypothetical protein
MDRRSIGDTGNYPCATGEQNFIDDSGPLLAT